MVEHELGKPEPKRWITEGNGLLASAMVVRAQWINLRTAMRESFRADHPLIARSTQVQTWTELEGLPRASILLLGYSLEMYLKAGLAKAYAGCRTASENQDGMFDRDARRFSHDYSRLADAIDFETSEEERGELNLLHDMVINSARYPLMPNKKQTHRDATRFDDLNSMTQTIWSQQKFDSLVSLVNKVSGHASRIDADSKNPASFGPIVPIDSDGYLVSRRGGHLSTRIVFRYSSKMMEANRNTLEELREEVEHIGGLLVRYFWDEALIIEDGIKKTEIHRGSQNFVPKR